LLSVNFFGTFFASYRVGDAYRDVGMTPFYFAYTGINPRPLMEKLSKVFLRADPQLGFVAPHLQSFTQTGKGSVFSVSLPSHDYDLSNLSSSVPFFLCV
jgi:hypothetical protein